eukprot:9593191-Prorocentrum_lima.AAC.1
MTSSLVGSEMCIRDRLLIGAARAFVAEKSCGIHGGLPAFPGAWTILSVSYTHLTLPTICSV